MKDKIPLLDFEPTREAIIEPSRTTKAIDTPEHCVLCFFQEVLSRLSQKVPFKQIARHRSEMGTHPLWEFELNGKRIAAFHPGLGDAYAAGMFEEVIARGCRKFIAVGSCGVLDDSITMGHALVPDRAVRDEGASFHYLPPAREVDASPEAVAAIENVLKRRDVPYIRTKTWTTAGFYRETQTRMHRRKQEGCLTVEMEAASLFAVAKFRNVTIGQLLYSGDSLAGEAWDSRGFTKDTSLREKMFWLAAEACLAIGE
ncbi:MAG: purine-nucleoside phosphorylase [Calditrichaeota bacterium]|nr:MAG: purine-nucleoside phosphorylase [Calditrichota bacterium]